MGFNESGEHKNTFIGSDEDHAFKVEPQGNVGHIAGPQEVQTQNLMDYHSARDKEQHSARELFKHRKDINETAFAVAVVEKIYARGTTLPQEDHAFEVEPQGNVGHIAGPQEVQTQNLMDYHSARDREQHSARELFKHRKDINETAFAVAAVEKIYARKSLTFNDAVYCEVISKSKAGLKEDMDARSNVCVLSNGCKESKDDINNYYWEYTPGTFIHLFLYIDVMVFSCGCRVEIWVTNGLLDEANGNILGMEIFRIQSRNTLRVSQSTVYNGGDKVDGGRAI
nr:zinc finger, CCHC-type [Tanacetum cinerariifolium]